MIYVAVVGDLLATLEKIPGIRHCALIGVDRQHVIQEALNFKKKWQAPGGHLQIWIGEITAQIELVPPVVEFKEIKFTS